VKGAEDGRQDGGFGHWPQTWNLARLEKWGGRLSLLL
jgi:hypothetical protein